MQLKVIPVGDWGLFPATSPFVIAGPCSAESCSQLLCTASELGSMGVGVFRAGLWKPRTHAGCFEGVGAAGLEWLSSVRSQYGMKVCVEVAGASHVKACLENGVDMLWIGARTTANPFLVQEIADALRGSSVPVLVKNPHAPDPELWMGALERLNAAGVTRLAGVLRGFPSFEPSAYRNAPHWEVAVRLKSRFPGLAIFCDPSHIAGDAALVPSVAQTALDMGLDGLMIEAHCNPSEALSDASQQLTPDALRELLSGLKVRYSGKSQPVGEIEELRARIDVLDEEIISMLARRIAVCREVARAKMDSNLSIIQPDRWDKVLSRVCSLAEDSGLDPEFISGLYNSIHEYSVKEQNNIISSYAQDQDQG